MRGRIQITALTLLALLSYLYLATVTFATPAGCQIPSIINDSTTLSPSECAEYLQTSNVIACKPLFSIEAGTIIKVDGLYILTIQGEMVARGTTENPIQFTSSQSQTQPGDWGHILFEETSTSATFDESGNYEAGSILQHAIIEYGGGISTGFNGMVIVNSSSPFINHVTIRQNADAAIRVRSNEDIKITNNLITENSDDSCMINVRGGGVTTIKDNIIRANTGDGYCSSWASGTSIISSNVIEENEGTGISQDGPLTIITNNTIMSNTKGGIFHSNGYAQISHNEIIGNQAPYGAGLRIVHFGTSISVFIHHNLILSNTAESSGGGLHLGCTLSPYIVSENIIRGNQVSNEDGAGGGVILIVPCRWARFTFNDIHDNEATNGSNFYNGLSSIYADVDARANYWGTDNESQIEDGVYHQIDNTGRGFVDYSGYLLEPISELSHLYLPTVQNDLASDEQRTSIYGPRQDAQAIIYP